ncbi:hypothetical protein ACQVT2_28030 [Bacillus paranthracis]|uniref:hypothetical protein n=1 Tax=Bacillus cereus group TaxID=86661 RepID=UPI0022DEC856|nr:hypothetical protein [Bacillus cereus group sp. Bc253]MDA2158622.1 hypothetical protein [Bacillus cereus group sp. Bc253]
MKVEKLEFLNINENYRICIESIELEEDSEDFGFHEFHVTVNFFNIGENVLEDDYLRVKEEVNIHVYLEDGFVYFDDSDFSMNLDDFSKVFSELEQIGRKMVTHSDFVEIVKETMANDQEELEKFDEEERNEGNRDFVYFTSKIKYFKEMLDVIENKQDQITLNPKLKKRIAAYRMKKIFK